MNHKLLLVAVVREVARLAAAIATYKDARASLANLDVHLFGALADALQRQGVGRRVSADMLGMVKRAFLRKVGKAKASITDRGRSLWEAVYDFVALSREVHVTQIEQRFCRDDAETLQGVLADMRESGVVRVQGRGKDALYRIPNAQELELEFKQRQDATDLVWTLIHHGTSTREALLARGVRPEEVDRSIAKLLEAQRIESSFAHGVECFHSSGYSIPAGTALEGAVLDHLHAVTTTLVTVISRPDEVAGATTFQLDVWPDHPLYAETLALYRDSRQRLSSLRTKIDAHNAASGQRLLGRRLNAYMGLSAETEPAG